MPRTETFGGETSPTLYKVVAGGVAPGYSQGDIITADDVGDLLDGFLSNGSIEATDATERAVASEPGPPPVPNNTTAPNVNLQPVLDRMDEIEAKLDALATASDKAKAAAKQAAFDKAAEEAKQKAGVQV